SFSTVQPVWKLIRPYWKGGSMRVLWLNIIFDFLIHISPSKSFPQGGARLSKSVCHYRPEADISSFLLPAANPNTASYEATAARPIAPSVLSAAWLAA